MNILSRPTSLLAASMVVLGLASLAGCGGVISNGGDGGDGGNGGAGGGGSGGAGGVTASTSTPGSGGGGGVGCDPGACPTQAVAMSHGQYLSAVGEDPNGIVTDTQFLLYGAGAETPTCSAPNGPSGACGGWKVHITIPTSYLTPGTYPLSDPEVDLYSTESTDEGNGMCAGAASGGLEEGEIIIHSVSDSVVTFSVQGVSQVFDAPVNGYFQADRCPFLD